ncbi:hypothetical protein CEXT_656131 [Caerostris extrusa]|uniref:Rhodanese domain-containing protein n=1 Tax=Caerostris extrusa TaxID=172846 RepID=A0AAV4SEF3_CAEEX|nr:hypothetical protein CEXT_656131 [Caerostris extrusa]
MLQRPMALRIFFHRVLSITSRHPAPSLSFISRNLATNMTEFNVIKFDSLKEKLLNHDIILIDVREPSELKDDGKIPNSVNIPLGQIGDAFKMTGSEFQSKYGIAKPDAEKKPFVLSCRSGKRATDAYQKLCNLGYNNIEIYSGSFLDWVKNGGLVEK